MDYSELANLMIKTRRKHRFFAQEGRVGDQYMVCECGARVRMIQEDPWDDFEAHRVGMIIAEMITAEVT